MPEHATPRAEVREAVTAALVALAPDLSTAIHILAALEDPSFAAEWRRRVYARMRAVAEDPFPEERVR